MWMSLLEDKNHQRYNNTLFDFVFAISLLMYNQASGVTDYMYILPTCLKNKSALVDAPMCS